ncbi:MAG: hypothetical protein LUD69_07875 [Oscillospiraceae bacterium]|nr:hypothetical protein [Oscillospiraceae bacterium]
MAEETNRAGTDIEKEFAGMVGDSMKFSEMSKMRMRDLNSGSRTPFFAMYSKDDIQRFLSNPYRYEKQLRRAVIYMYGASSHFWRLIQYFVGLTDFAYVVEPYKIDPKKTNARILGNNYRKVLNLLAGMNIKNQFKKILTVCLREDVFYGTMHISGDNITIQQLPSDYCAISSVEDGVPNVTFDFTYFDKHKDRLDYYPEEFRLKYENVYKKQLRTRWVELDSPTSFAVKCNSDILHYAMPPFAGLLRELYDLEEYKRLKMRKTGLENYAMLAMMIPLDSNGDWGIDMDKARDFWKNLDAVLPEEVGSVLTPMEINKISFEKSNTADTDTISDAEQHLFTAAGVSSLLFNNESASANALLLSIKNDQSITYGIVKSIGDVINRYLWSQSYGKNFKVNMLNVSAYNSKEVGDSALKAATYGLPMISIYAASQGLGQAELDSMSFLETTVLGLQDVFRPLQSSAQMSSSDTAAAQDSPTDGEPGAPKKDVGELTDSGEQSSEDSDDWG